MKKIKYNHAIDQTPEIIEIQKTIRNWIGLAQYEKGYKFVKKQQTKYPSSYYLASMVATLKAEDAYVLPEKQMKKAFDEAAKQLKQLLYSSKGATKHLKNRNINEYYWFSQQPKKQYQFGVKRVATGDMHGMYSIGVGAANYAYQLSLEGKKGLALKWANKSQLSWEKYFKKVSSDYHDPWYWYAMALGIQGKEKEMNLALIKSSKLAKKSLKNYPAFKKLRQMMGVIS